MTYGVLIYRANRVERNEEIDMEIFIDYEDDKRDKRDFISDETIRRSSSISRMSVSSRTQYIFRHDAETHINLYVLNKYKQKKRTFYVQTIKDFGIDMSDLIGY